MRVRRKRLATAVAVTIIDVVASKCYSFVIWQTFTKDVVARAYLLWLLILWIASSVVIWLHVGHDLPQILREQRHVRALFSRHVPSEDGRESNV